MPTINVPNKQNIIALDMSDAIYKSAHNDI